MNYTLPKLPYAFDALEPHIDARTVEIHYTIHHQAYIDKLNDALSKAPELADTSLEQLISDKEALPEAVRDAVWNNAGGHFAHSLYWQCMKTDGGMVSEGAFLDAINDEFGSALSLKEKMTEVAAGQFGSGWAWLFKDKEGNLGILSTPNHDTPLAEGKTPLLVIDVWEHAYYLKYQNRRPEHIDAWWNVVNWEYVAGLFLIK
ncbi:superoxide dismutase [Patescibacteria group bacterium]|nr:superoxide dismutase [Patescibacteria group bacterium]